MSNNVNKQLVRRAFAVFNGEDNTPLSQLLAPDFVTHEPHDGINGVAGVTMLRTAFPDVRYTIEDELIADGDKVVSRWRASGTHQGPCFGAAPSGKVVAWTGITIWRVVEGRIVEVWVNRDTLSLLQQVGVLPSGAA